MEYIEALCCGSVNGSINTVTLFLNKFKQELLIVIHKREGTCLADFTLEEIDEEDVKYHEPFEARIEYTYKEESYKMEIERITRSDKRFFWIRVEYLCEDTTSFVDSTFYEQKTKIITFLNSSFEQVLWLSDSQNVKMATELYSRLHELENYLRAIINRYMSIKHGGDWFEKYSYEDYINKYLKFSEWFKNSNYNLFKMVDNHLYNLEIDDIFKVLKAAKKKPVSKLVQKALEDIKKHGKESASEIANISLLDTPSLWEEEKFDEVFEQSVIGRWQEDLAKRRNMVAHNKLICREMYNDTLQTIVFFYEKFREADRLLKRKLKSDEFLEAQRIRIDDEMALNFEYCDINPELPDEQEIIEKLNETDDFIELSGILCDKIYKIKNEIEDVLSMLDDIKSSLYVDNFFEDGCFVGKVFLEQYIEFAKDYYQYSDWKSLLRKEMCVEIYNLIEPGIMECILKRENQLKKIQDSLFSADLNCFSEGMIAKMCDFEGNEYKLIINGWFCPERGGSDVVYVEWNVNEDNCERGEIYVSYGDYDMTEDGIPMPYVEDGISVSLGCINREIEKVIDLMLIELENLENIIMKIEI